MVLTYTNTSCLAKRRRRTPGEAPMIEQTSLWKHSVSRLRGLRKDRRAVIAVVTALVFPVLLAFAALAFRRR